MVTETTARLLVVFGSIFLVAMGFVLDRLLTYWYKKSRTLLVGTDPRRRDIQLKYVRPIEGGKLYWPLNKERRGRVLTSGKTSHTINGQGRAYHVDLRDLKSWLVDEDVKPVIERQAGQAGDEDVYAAFDVQLPGNGLEGVTGWEIAASATAQDEHNVETADEADWREKMVTYVPIILLGLLVGIVAVLFGLYKIYQTVQG